MKEVTKGAICICSSTEGRHNGTYILLSDVKTFPFKSLSVTNQLRVLFSLLVFILLIFLSGTKSLICHVMSMYHTSLSLECINWFMYGSLELKFHFMLIISYHSH